MSTQVEIDAIRKELVSSFGSSDLLTEDVCKELGTLMSLYQLSSDDLYIKWESFNVAEVQENLDLTIENIDRFQKYLQSSLSTSRATPTAKRARDIQGSNIKKKPIIRSNADFNSSSPVIPSTPNLKKRKVIEEATPAFKTPRADFNASSPADFNTANNTFQSPSTPNVSKKQESNTIIETLNPEIDVLPGFVQLDEDPATSLKPYKLMYNFDASKFKYRTMSMKLLESADVLDDQIDSFTQLYIDNHKEDGNLFGNPCISSQFDINCCGRIVPDSPNYDKTASVQLNSTSLYLETSRINGIGQRIPLDLSQLKGYSFFPGQIVLLRGRNPTGRSFTIKEVLEIPELGAAVSSRQDLEEFEEMTAENGLKIMVAAGPFSNHHSLNYSKLEELTEIINNSMKPHVVVLNGPFIDITNSMVASGDIEIPDDKSPPRNLDELFKKLISPILRKIDSRIQVILIPSVNDTAIKHCSYPQDSFERKKFGLPKNVRIVPNPSSVSVNEVLIANSNLDVFKDLKDVHQENPEGKSFSNRFERIANHIFEQRRFYPVFPGSIKRVTPFQTATPPELHEGIMGKELSFTSVGGPSLEVPYLGLTELGDSLPDILISPSDLKSFVKVISGVVVINPGYYIKLNKDPTREDGTYAVINITPPQLNAGGDNNVQPVSEDSELYFHNIHKRTRVDIYST
ncbi:hypothetical protein G9P44_004968 [Scheffersomyces stipitis]|nr:hypothetical protein G9P44_004968 [Scheffersomyces stipitis]